MLPTLNETLMTTQQIKIPALKRPTLATMQKQFSWVTSIERDTSPTKAVTLNIGTLLTETESKISGAEYEKRIPQESLGFQHAQWLVEHQDEFTDFKAMTGIYIDFPGQIVVDEDGRRYVFYLNRFDGRWCLDYHWLDSDFRRSGRVASFGKVAIGVQTLGSPLALEPLATRVSKLEAKMEKIMKIGRILNE